MRNTPYFCAIARLGTGDWGLGIGDWGLETGDWGLGIRSNRNSVWLG
ncbi:hypothetical protein H6F74_28635 [Trichocoleus sp. FACHB-90]|nr:hypothetical protein [Trichocoleus sp. FACHB-90]MBD1930158.1 hypothetical protein [Trichocoleus sp. FACHB-90]